MDASYFTNLRCDTHLMLIGTCLFLHDWNIDFPKLVAQRTFPKIQKTVISTRCVVEWPRAQMIFCCDWYKKSSMDLVDAVNWFNSEGTQQSYWLLPDTTRQEVKQY